MEALIIFAWWLLGMSSLLWLKRGSLIWGDLAVFCVISVLGPLIWLLVVIAALASAKFWTKPVFPKRDGR